MTANCDDKGRCALTGAAATATLVAAMALGLAACDGPAGPPASSEVEVVSWWTEGGEANALQSLLTLFSNRYPHQKVIDAVVTGSNKARETIRNRMLGGQPPETFQANGGWGLLAWVLYNQRNEADSKMEPIDSLAAEEGWNAVIPKPVLDTVSFGGHTYAVPLNIHRLNTLFFNKQLFIQYGIAEPKTLDQLFAVAAAFRDRGITPIAVGAVEPWTLSLLLFENLLVARAGGPYYRDFLVGHGDAWAPEVAAALEDLRTLLSFANTNATQLTWSGAVELVRTGKAAMTIMGDWAKGYFLANQGVPEVSFGEIATPGTGAAFVFTTDTFGLPMGVRNRAGALDLLRVFGSREGQDTFNPIKGSIPARKDANVEAYDVMAQNNINDFRDAAAADPTMLVPATALLAPPEFTDAVEHALATFVVDGNASAVLHTLDNWYDLLRPSPWQ